MPSSGISVRASTLMHASLAYLSSEFQTFASIIRLHSNNTLVIYSESVSSLHPSLRTTLNSLPPEMLLKIQSYLLPALISHLSTLSDRALTSYESSVLSLLCADCQAYNKHVYGSTFWNWPHFSGSCRCTNFESRCGSLFEETTHEQTNSDLNPKQFRNPHHWLEAHLSTHAITTRPGLWTHMDKCRETIIWDLVTNVLCDFECGVFNEDGNPLLRSATSDGGRNVSIIVAPLHSGTGETEHIKEQKTIIIGRAWRDLGLQVECKDPGGREEDSRPFRTHVSGKLLDRQPPSNAYDVGISVGLSTSIGIGPSQTYVVRTLFVVWCSSYALLLAALVCVYR